MEVMVVAAAVDSYLVWSQKASPERGIYTETEWTNGFTLEWVREDDSTQKPRAGAGLGWFESGQEGQRGWSIGVTGLLREKRLERAGAQTPGPQTPAWRIWGLFSACRKSDCVTQLCSISWTQSNFPAWTTRSSMAQSLTYFLFYPHVPMPWALCACLLPTHVGMQSSDLDRSHTVSPHLCSPFGEGALFLLYLTTFHSPLKTHKNTAAFISLKFPRDGHTFLSILLALYIVECLFLCLNACPFPPLQDPEDRNQVSFSP